MQAHFPRIVVFTFMIVALCSITTFTQAQPARRCFNVPSDPNYNPDIRYCIEGSIRQYWESNGGLYAFGYPITIQHEAGVEGIWRGQVQWFERDRLEDHGAEGVLTGRLGARWLELQRRPWTTFPTVTSAPANCDYFDITKHSLCEPFRSYWHAQGGLTRFGYPITQPFFERIGSWSGSVQYFERRRMEHHSEQANPDFKVLLGLLGSYVCTRDCLPGQPAPPPPGP
jgi:hypothetical protein